MGFAARCILNNPEAFDRVIIALPFTSIIDQMADTLRKALEEATNLLAVLEHHSLTDPEARATSEAKRVALEAAEANWDHAPLVVTTFVQLLESLLSNQPRRMRKLHSIARSTIMLDEIEVLLTHQLETTMDVLRALAETCGCVVVLSTATQPPFEQQVECLKNIKIHEITRRPDQLERVLRRVQYEEVGSRDAPVTPARIADEAARQPQPLVVVNTHRDALRIMNKMTGVAGLRHLSARLYPAHRRAVIAGSKADLRDGHSVRLVSTQVIEAGVDLDFPWEARVYGPLGSIVQTAGRVNREDMLRDAAGQPMLGTLVVFHLEAATTPGEDYITAINTLDRIRHLMPMMRDDTDGVIGLDFADPAFIRRYYSDLMYRRVDLKGIHALRRQLDFPAVADQYKLIDEQQISLCVDYRQEGHAPLASLIAASAFRSVPATNPQPQQARARQ